MPLLGPPHGWVNPGGMGQHWYSADVLGFPSQRSQQLEQADAEVPENLPEGQLSHAVGPDVQSMVYVWQSAVEATASS